MISYPLRVICAVAAASMAGICPLAADAGGPAPSSEPPHWAYLPPVHRDPPSVRQTEWARNPMDLFVLARLEKEGLNPSPSASKEQLLRRVSLDLIGLPPAPEDVTAFLNDTRPDAYDRWVEHLLSSPQYGERWAQPWLDQARYADSNGYEADYKRSIWPYRDWVIRALNGDMPFDQFTIEQLAGDLLPNPTRDQRIATGFHRNTMVNTEGGTDDEEFRVAAIVDRVNTTFEVWMGTTLGCAQCHNHKYDPFSQKEYYEVFAIFNQTKDRGRSNDPQLELTTPADEAERSRIKAALVPLEKILNTSTPKLEAAQIEWEQPFAEAFETVAKTWHAAVPQDVKATGGVVLDVLGDGSVLASGPLPDNAEYELTLPSPGRGVTGIRIEALVDGSLPHRSSGRSDEGDFVLTEVNVEAIENNGDARALPTKFALAYASHQMSRYECPGAIDENPATGWSIAAHEPENRANHEAAFIFAEPVDFEGPVRVRLRQDSVRARHLLGRFRLSWSRAPAETHQVWSKLPGPVRRIVAQPAGQRSAKQAERLAAHYRSIAPSLDPVRAEVEALKKQEPKNIPATLVMEAVEKPRSTHLLIRGSHLNPGAEVAPNVPSVLHPYAKEAPLNRLQFARWLVDPANPLVGRVIMNRIWAQYFGTGIVETSEEFGAQGERPSHPELLDWLATEFVRQGWKLKSMHRLIVTSATYRQSSSVTQELYERDPYNRLLARGPRSRLPAEMLRDNALAVSGLLDLTLGGPSIFPYQPPGVWNSPYNGDRWETSAGGDQFRRGVYTFWRRTAPYPSFMAFDAPSREVSCERRARSNTPIQALVTLNDPAFLAPANALAVRILRQSATAFETRLEYAFLCCVSRSPTESERATLAGLFRTALERFTADPDAAREMAGAGGLPLPDGLDAAEVAAWSVIANTLLNLDETLTKS